MSLLVLQILCQYNITYWLLNMNQQISQFAKYQQNSEKALFEEPFPL